MPRIDTKAAAGTMGGALSLIVWVLLAAFVERVGELAPETLAVLVGATGTVLTGALAYLVPNEASPPPYDGRTIELTPEEQAGHACEAGQGAPPA